MQFWGLTEPEYKSDYRFTYVNGSLDRPFGLPGISCHHCGATWSGSRALPFEIPNALRKRKTLRERWPVSVDEFQALADDLTAEFTRAGVSVPNFLPGDDLQPAFLDVPSRPQFDFLWAAVGVPVVSQRVRDVFEVRHVEGVEFCPVTLRKIGARSVGSPAPMPSTGEPEDMLNEVPLLEKTDGLGPYYQLLVQAESGYPPGGEPTSVCATCGRETVDANRRRLVMLPSMWRGAPIFRLATTLWILVIDDLARSLREHRFTNLKLQRYPSA